VCMCVWAGEDVVSCERDSVRESVFADRQSSHTHLPACLPACLPLRDSETARQRDSEAEPGTICRKETKGASLVSFQDALFSYLFKGCVFIITYCSVVSIVSR
jgi:hypothetical protein